MYGITIEEATRNLASGRTDDILDLIFKRYEVRRFCLGSNRMGFSAVMQLHLACWNVVIS